MVEDNEQPEAAQETPASPASPAAEAEALEPKESKEPKEGKEPKEPKETKETRESRGSQSGQAASQGEDSQQLAATTPGGVPSREKTPNEGAKSDEEPPVSASPNASTEKSKDWLVFRMCEVYSAPRLPHVTASQWKPIVQSAEHMKFGVCKFGKMAGVDPKDRERQRKIKTGELKPVVPERPPRPRVPPAPRRVVAKPPEIDLTEPDQQAKAPTPKASPSQGHGNGKLKREPVECPWCGAMEAPTHPKQCKLRLVECKYCKQEMELGSLRLHFKSCAARPMAQQTESRAPKNGSQSSAFMTLHRLQSTAAHVVRQLEASWRRLLVKQPQADAPEQVFMYMAKLETHLALLGEELSDIRQSRAPSPVAASNRQSASKDRRGDKTQKAEVEDLQKRLYLIQAQVAHAEQMAVSWQAVLKAGERSKMHCGVSRLQSTVQTVHRQLDDLTQQAVEADMGDPKTNPDYAPEHLEANMEAMKEEVTALDRSQQTMMAHGAAPSMEGLSDLAGRLHFFQELLRCVTEAVAKNDHSSTLASIARPRPGPGPKRKGLPPLSAREPEESREVFVEEEPLLPPPQQVQQADFHESSPLPPDRGPAAMGLREMSLDQMREEIDEERKRYIAYHLGGRVWRSALSRR
mmetsp:Transcript_48737/g.113790  ORF Transcript_48737/g.113790 Transcript_48737/m.113790 type:complete len:635 (-) Transcript_48737:261-2165(-)